MVQSAHLRQFDHRTQFGGLNRALFRSVFAQRKMSTGTPVVPEIRLQGPPQRGLIEHDYMIQTLTPIDPMSRSTYGDCQGDRGAVRTSRMPISLTWSGKRPA